MTNDLVTKLVLGAIALVVLALLTFVWWVWPSKIRPWFDARLTATQRELIDRFARDGYAWVEANFAGTGREKFEKACEWLSTKLTRIGVKIPPEELEAAVQKAWEEFNARCVGSGPVTVNVNGNTTPEQTEELARRIESGVQTSLEKAVQSVVDPKG